MPRGPKLLSILLVGLALAGLGGPAPAQDQLDTFIRTPYSVPDSQEVLLLTLDAKAAVEKGNFDTAVLMLQKILDYHTSQVVLTGPEINQRFVGARTWVNAYLRSLPPTGRAAYRRATEHKARELLARATNTNTPVLQYSEIN